MWNGFYLKKLLLDRINRIYGCLNLLTIFQMKMVKPNRLRRKKLTSYVLKPMKRNYWYYSQYQN